MEAYVLKLFQTPTYDSDLSRSVIQASTQQTAKGLTIAVVTETWYPDINGVAHSIGKIVQGLLDLGVHIQLYHLQEDNAIIDDRIEYHALKGKRLPFYKEVKIGFPASRKLQQYWKKSRPDIVQIVTEGPLGYSAMRAARQMHIPAVSDYHTNFQQYSRSYHFGLLENIVFAYLRKLHNQTGMTLVPTQQLRIELEALGFDNVNIMARGIDTKAFNPKHRCEHLRKEWGVVEDHPVVLYVGRVAAEKNLDLAVKTFRYIQQQKPAAKFIIVGDGPVRKTLEQNNPDFIFCGMQRGQTLAEHYASADIFLSPSVTETFGNTILEAMASGLAVVSYDYAAAREYIVHLENGITAPLHNEENFVQQACELAKSTEHQQQLGKQAHASIQENSWNSVCSNLLNTLQQYVKETSHD
jgi:glycosyltransferase involved in cell wall biosynthesis